MKRLLSLSLFLMTVMLSFAQRFEENGIYCFSTSPYTVGVTSGYPRYTGAVTIPSSVTYEGKAYSVTCIGKQAFYNCTELTSVIIPNSVTTIDDEAFSGCSNLTSVTIGNAVKTIGYYSFSGCSSLTSIEIPNRVTYRDVLKK